MSELKLGLPKGSLQESTFSLLKNAGWSFSVSSRSYYPRCDDPEIWSMLARPQEMSRWLTLAAKSPRTFYGLLARRALGIQTRFDFKPHRLTEAGSKKRASLHIVRGCDALAELDPKGLETLECDLNAFAERLTLRNHTLKRALTDPRLFSGIGNAYSDEILFHAKLSPLKLTQKLPAEDVERLYEYTKKTLEDWTDILREEAKSGFPKKVTAFRDEMAVHGKYKQPCPVCGTKVQRIVYAENETNYCPTCQNEGRLLRDRSLSRLLKDDWPKTVDELEAE